MDDNLKRNLDDLNNLIAMIDPELGNKILSVLGEYMDWIEIARSLPDFIVEPVANIFMHNIIWGLKSSEQDTKRHREITLSWTVKLFDLSADWEPKWVMEPYNE